MLHYSEVEIYSKYIIFSWCLGTDLNNFQKDISNSLEAGLDSPCGSLPPQDII